jgi:hypothetical protein
MKKYVVTFTDGSTRTIDADHYEEAFGALTFYDEDGDQTETLAAGTWKSVAPEAS